MWYVDEIIVTKYVSRMGEVFPGPTRPAPSSDEAHAPKLNIRKCNHIIVYSVAVVSYVSLNDVTKLYIF